MPSRLLAIDDEPDQLAILMEVAESEGVSVHVTTEPDDFKSAAVTRAPDLILLDLQMPRCDGVQLLRFLADQRCPATVVLMSGFDARVLAITHTMGLELGLKMGGTLQKPIRIGQLRELFGAIQAAHFEIDSPTIRAALGADQFQLFYQPLVNLRDRTLWGWEALIRWFHPQRGLIMPDRFIPIAERDDVIDALTERVLEMSVAQMGEWRRQGYDSSVSVNLSARNLADAAFPDRLVELCAREEVPNDRLCLELTETAAMKDPVLIIQILTRLRLKGFKLAIDDFGTGYSSLIQLYRLPFSEIKIDQKFVAQMEQSDEANVIVGAITNLAHNLHLIVVAEGIESSAVAARLVDFGCERGQGYYFGRPMPAREVLDWAAGFGARE